MLPIQARIMPHVPLLCASGPKAPAGDDAGGRLRDALQRRVIAASEKLLQGSRALTHLLKNGSEPLPSLETVREDGLHFAEPQNVVDEWLKSLFGEEHLAYNLMGLAEVGNAVARALADYASVVGIRQLITEYRATKSSDKRLPVEAAFLERGRVAYQRFFMKWARANQMSVRFEGLEKIPAEGPVVYLAMPHATIFPDFFFSLADPMVMPVADAHNFHDNATARQAGFALIMDKIGLPLLHRPKPKDSPEEKVRKDEANRALMDNVIAASMQFGLRPMWFPHGGRVPAAFTEYGQPERAGFYSTITDPAHPKLYIQTGGAMANAAALAMAVGEPIKIGIVTIEGAERVMAKRTKSFPFIQANGAWQTVTFRVVDFLELEPDNRRQMIQVGRKIPQLAKESLGIDPFLREKVREWATRNGSNPDAVADQFWQKATARKGEVFFIIADRIRSIHPLMTQPEHMSREQAIVELLRLIEMTESEIDQDKKGYEQEVEQLLVDVSETVLATQYSRPKI